jgi:pyridoxamine 5'-phosphate oxidase
MEAAELLRGVPVMTGPFPEFDVEAAPEAPGELFMRWLERAVSENVTEPHVVSLSTADRHGRPSSRVLMLRDVDEERAGWVFASHGASRKGAELAHNPWGALLVYWAEQGRQVRVCGRVEAGSSDVNARDFLARSEPARAAGLTGRQSAHLTALGEFDAAWAQAEELVRDHPEAVPPDYTVYTLWADEVEFWQGDSRRRHLRLCYTREETGWSRQLLWP